MAKTLKIDFLSARTTAKRMEMLERFIALWHGPRLECYGATGEMAAPLPKPLDRLYRFAGRWPSPDSELDSYFYQGAAYHHLQSPDGVDLTSDGKLEFYMEYQGDWTLVTLPSKRDPPVWIRGSWFDPETGDQIKGEQKLDIPLSACLINHVLLNTIQEMENSPCRILGELARDYFDEYRKQAVKIWEIPESGFPFWYSGDFYLLPNGILAFDGGFSASGPEGLKLYASRPRGVQRLCALFRRRIKELEQLP